jgi:hypothetical protein
MTMEKKRRRLLRRRFRRTTSRCSQRWTHGDHCPLALERPPDLVDLRSAVVLITDRRRLFGPVLHGAASMC